MAQQLWQLPTDTPGMMVEDGPRAWVDLASEPLRVRCSKSGSNKNDNHN